MHYTEVKTIEIKAQDKHPIVQKSHFISSNIIQPDKTQKNRAKIDYNKILEKHNIAIHYGTKTFGFLWYKFCNKSKKFWQNFLKEKTNPQISYKKSKCRINMVLL